MSEKNLRYLLVSLPPPLPRAIGAGESGLVTTGSLVIAESRVEVITLNCRCRGLARGDCADPSPEGLGPPHSLRVFD